MLVKNYGALFLLVVCIYLKIQLTKNHYILFHWVIYKLIHYLLKKNQKVINLDFCYTILILHNQLKVQ